MSTKLQGVIEFLQKNPDLAKKDPNLLREIQEVCINFPGKLENESKKDLFDEFNETTMINMLTAFFMSIKTIQDVLHLKPDFHHHKLRSGGGPGFDF